MILSTFSSSDQADKFKLAAGLSTVTGLTVNITMPMVDLARFYGGLVEQTDFDPRRYVIKTEDVENLNTTATVINHSISDGNLRIGTAQYFVVDSAFGLSLYDELNGQVDLVDIPVKMVGFFEVNDNVNFPADYQWGRLRLISRNRPFATEWALAESYFSTTTNLVIMDSGINFDHREFEGLKTEDFYTLPRFNDDYRDDKGHGTGVASFACGKNLGVHREVNLMNCKILSNTHKPNALEIYQALDAVYNRYVSNPLIPMVVNMSWITEKNNFLNHKIENMIEAGIGIVCAAGNIGMDVSLLTPAGIKNAVTVAASDSDDIGAGFNDFSVYDQEITTNHGLNIDIFAPGVDVIAAGISSNSSYLSVSGTSASCAYVSGCMTAIMSLIPNTYGNDAKEILIDYSTKGALLLDLDLYSYKQNNLAYLINANSSHVITSSTYYLGYIKSYEANSTSTTIIPGNINQLIDVSRYSLSTGVEFNYEYTTNSAKDKAILDNCLILKPNGDFVISPPAVNWEQGERLNLVEFRINVSANDESIYFSSPKLFFFVVNPSEIDNISGDISTALDNMDAQSFFASWQRSELK